VSDLPEGWAECSLGEVLQQDRGIFDGPFGSSLKTSDYVVEGVRVVRLENVGKYEFIESKRTWISHAKFEQLRKHEVRSGDLIVGSFVDDRVRVCVLPDLQTPAIAKADCFCLRPAGRVIDRRFLMYQLGLSSTRDALLEQIHGATRPRITTKQLKDLIIKVPPPTEQRRIVQKVEALLALTDKCESNAQRAGLRLGAARAAFVDSITTGRFFEEEWPTRRLGESLMNIQAGRSFRCEERPPTADEVGVVKVSAVTWGEYDEVETKTCTDPTMVEPSFFIREGDLLFSRANTIDLVGACVIASKVTRNVMLSDKILRLTFDETVDPRWVLWSLRSARGRAEIERLATGNQESMRNIGQERIRQTEIAFPDRKRQERAIDLLVRLIQPVEKQQQRLKRLIGDLAETQRSVLKKAFSGELVPTEAELARHEGRDYESALELINRIAVDRVRTSERGSRSGASRSGGSTVPRASRGARSPRR
jgi:restriction endonuclease S subunit